MSRGLGLLRRVMLLVLVLVVNACGQRSAELVFESVHNFGTVGSPTRSTVVSSPIYAPSSPASREISTSQQITFEFSQLINLRLQCGRQPATCPVAQLTAPGSKYREYLTALMKLRTDSNLATRSGAGKFRFRIESIDVSSPSSAVVHTCIFDSLVVFDSGQSNSTRDDIVFDDDVISGHTTWQIVDDDGKWKWSDATSTDSVFGRDICGFVS